MERKQKIHSRGLSSSEIVKTGKKDIDSVKYRSKNAKQRKAENGQGERVKKSSRTPPLRFRLMRIVCAIPVGRFLPLIAIIRRMRSVTVRGFVSIIRRRVRRILHQIRTWIVVPCTILIELRIPIPIVHTPIEQWCVVWELCSGQGLRRAMRVRSWVIIVSLLLMLLRRHPRPRNVVR